eukprot:4112963-Prymnesium_polylepis.1
MEAGILDSTALALQELKHEQQVLIGQPGRAAATVRPISAMDGAAPCISRTGLTPLQYANAVQLQCGGSSCAAVSAAAWRASDNGGASTRPQPAELRAARTRLE